MGRLHELHPVAQDYTVRELDVDHVRLDVGVVSGGYPQAVKNLHASSL